MALFEIGGPRHLDPYDDHYLSSTRHLAMMVPQRPEDRFRKSKVAETNSLGS